MYAIKGLAASGGAGFYESMADDTGRSCADKIEFVFLGPLISVLAKIG